MCIYIYIYIYIYREKERDREREIERDRKRERRIIVWFLTELIRRLPNSLRVPDAQGFVPANLASGPP